MTYSYRDSENGVFQPFVDGESIVESVRQQADDQMEEAAGDYLECIDSKKLNELSVMLTKTLNEWSEKHGYKCSYYCSYYPVNNVKKYTVEIFKNLDAENEKLKVDAENGCIY